MTMNAVSNIERAKALYLAFSTGDFQTVIEALSSPIDFKANYPAGTALQAWAGQRSSPEEVLSYLSAVFTLQDIEVWETRSFLSVATTSWSTAFSVRESKRPGEPTSRNGSTCSASGTATSPVSGTGAMSVR